MNAQDADYARIRVDQVDGVTTLTLNRPECGNAIDDRMHSEFSRILLRPMPTRSAGSSS